MSAEGDSIRPTARSIRALPWNILDQGAFSLTSLLLVVAAAHLTRRSTFNSLALVLLLYAASLGVQRALIGNPLLVRSIQTGRSKSVISDALGDAIGVGICGGIAVGCLAVAMGGQWSEVLGMLALGLPILVLQDACRYALFLQSRYRGASIIDALWLLVQLVLTGVLWSLRGPIIGVAVEGTWLVGAAISMVVAVRLLGLWPHPSLKFRFLRSSSRLGLPLLGEFASITGATQLGLALLAVVVGAGVLGSWRAAMLLMGPMTVIVLSAIVHLENQGSGTTPRGSSEVVPLMVGAGLAMTGLLGVLVLGWLLVPHAGSIVLGREWIGARALLVPVAFFIAGDLWTNVASVGMRIRGQQRRSFLVRTAVSPAYVIVPVLVGVLSGALASVKALAGVALFDAGLLWTVFFLWPGRSGGGLTERIEENYGSATVQPADLGRDDS